MYKCTQYFSPGIDMERDHNTEENNNNWLERLLKDKPGGYVRNPFGDRIQKEPTEEGTVIALEVAEKIPETDLPRMRPGFHARRDD